MRNLYIHCGLPKTGTTSLQKYLAAARSELRGFGFDYPDVGVSADRTAHHNLAREILRDRRFAPERGTAQDFCRYIDCAGDDTSIILSSEGLTHCLFRAQPALFAFLRALMARSGRVSIIFTFRKFWQISESSFLYDLSHGDGGGRAKPVNLGRTRKWLRNLAAGFTELRQVVGDDHFLLCDDADHGDTVNLFLEVLGIPLRNQDRAEVRLNRRMGLKKAALLYRLQYGGGGGGVSLTPQQLAKARRLILGIPDFPGDSFAYRVMPYEDANAIQSIARAALPSFVSTKIEHSLRAEEPYESVDLRGVAFARGELDVVRAALPAALSAKFAWPTEAGNGAAGTQT